MNEGLSSVQVLPGVGPKRLKPLAELGIETIWLVNAFPVSTGIKIRDVNTIMDQESH